MSMSTFDVITSKIWYSRGAVILPFGKIPRVGYFPCYGAMFAPRKESIIDTVLTLPEVYTWEGEPIYGQVVAKQPRPLKFRAFKFDALNPTNLLQIPSGTPDVDRLPPQAMLTDEYIEKFSNLLFVEHGDVLVSNAMTVSGENLEGVADDEVLAITFAMELYYASNTVYMLQRAYWSDGYTGTYCCG